MTIQSCGANPLYHITIIISITLILLELATRVVFPIPAVINFERAAYSPNLSSSQPYSLANTSFTWQSMPDHAQFTHHLNLYGFRDNDWSIQSKQYRVAFVGDSFVEGFMAPDHETIPHGFALAAKKQHRSHHALETLNFGVGAAGWPEYFHLIRDMVPLFKPNSLFLILYMNDFLQQPALSPHFFTQALMPQFNSMIQPRLWHVLQATYQHQYIPKHWHAPPFPFLPAIPDPRNPWSDPIQAKQLSHFVTPDIATAMRQGQFNPFIAGNLDQWQQRLSLSPQSLSQLTQLQQFLQRYNTQLSIVYLPSRLHVSDYYLTYQRQYSTFDTPSFIAPQPYINQLKIQCQQLKIPFLDMSSWVKQREQQGQHLYWDYDEHFKGASYLAIGQYLFNWSHAN